MLETKEQLIEHVKQFPDAAHAFASLKVTKCSPELSDWFYEQYSRQGKDSILIAFNKFYSDLILNIK